MHAVCDYAVCGKGPFGNAEAGCRKDELPLTLVDNLETTPPFSTKAYCLPGKPARFYAAVPIRTKRGINIGVYCVLHSKPVPEWGHQQTSSLREISRLIMSHLEAKRDRGSHRRAERMARGMGSFLDHKTTLSGWKGGSFPAAYVNQPELEGDLNARQQASPSQSTNLTQDEHESSEQTLLDQMQSRRTDSSKGQSGPAHGSSHGGRQRASTPINIKTLPPPKTFRNGLGDDDDDKSVQHIFSKAANILRESIETEGCLFVDPSSTTFGSFSQEPKTAGATEPSSSSTSSGEDTSGQPDGETPSLAHCPVLGFSTSTHHSINDDSDVGFRDKVAQKFVATLIRRYPKGHVFNFDANGEPLLSDSSEEKSLSGSDGSPTGPTASPLQNQKPRRPNPWARERDGSNLLEIFPGAKSVAFMPMWDSKRERWHAAGFVYTYQSSRWFTDDGELSFFKAFSMLITEGLLRHETLLAAKAKSDALSCISHELRSPLHGILLGVELLNDTSLSVFQGDVSHTIETCCRTLVDTVDHLLDYSKINNFDSNRSQQVSAPPRTRGLSGSTSRTLEAGMMSLKSTINLSLLAEEVVESVFAGFYFQQMSVRQMSNKPGQFADSAGNSKLDTMRAMDDLGSVDQSGPQELTAKVGDVYVFLMIDPNCCWTFYAEGGALRRIIMNIFGNSLKYTHQGAIRVSITQASTRKDSTKGPNRVIITVSDTGIGMSQDFLDNHLFEPFSQENSISPGTGLGLSIVKKIVSQQCGRISVKSHLGVGTSLSVTLPLRPQGSPATDGNKALSQALASFNADVHELRNLRVRLVGFESSTLATRDAVDVEGQTFDSLSLLQNVCANWLKLEVISEADKETTMPDLVILSEDTHISRTNEKDLMSIPTVVVCRNALVAYQYTDAYRLENRYDQFDRVLEFISQP